MNEERVEAAAQFIGGVLDYPCGGDWEKIPKTEQDRYRIIAKCALEFSVEAAWQPIDTAPRDGSRILAVCSGGVYFFSFWDIIEKWFCDGDDVFYETSELTHWMPLPKPPTDEA